MRGLDVVLSGQEQVTADLDIEGKNLLDLSIGSAQPGARLQMRYHP